MQRFFEDRGDFIRKTALWILPVVGGIVLTTIDGKRDWLGGFAAYAGLLLASLLLLDLSFRKMRVDSWAKRFGFGVFWLRLALGIGLMGLLPVLGYQDSLVSQAGYVFQDAYVRDGQAWELAASQQPILSAFSGKYSGDQYGGMLALSAATYRSLSPQYHRPLLVLIWIALAGALSVVIFWQVAKEWSAEISPQSPGYARAAAVIFAFYPEAVLLSSSHMREAVVLLGVTLLMRGYLLLVQTRTGWVKWFLVGGFILMAFQAPLAVATLIVMLGMFLLEPGKKSDWRVALVFLTLILVALAGSFLVFAELPSLADASPAELFQTWLAKNFNFQSHLAERSSGMLQKLLDSAGERFTIPVVIGYGVLQPVLPAALVDPAALVWRVINILRAVGWYILAPVLLYSALTVFYPSFQVRRWQRLWLCLVCFSWILIAAANAGGDQWDNPRYRTLFLPWMTLLALWTWSWARQHQDAWRYRFMVVSGIFSLLFLQWYLSRYISLLIHLDIRIMIVLTFSVITFYLAACLVRDLWRRKRAYER